MTINLGDKAKDSISGFTGIVTGKFSFLNGCVRMRIDPDKLDKSGLVIDGRDFDEEQLVLVKAAKARIVAPSGGPRPGPSSRPAPTR
jgi:hypothetical protein